MIVYETDKHNIPLRKAMKDHTISTYPSATIISGRSGSGKTNVLMNLLKRKEYYHNYFHFTLIFSPTASIDDLYSDLKIPKDLSEDKLQRIIDVRKELIEKRGIEWVGKNSRMLIIIDDAIGSNRFLQCPQAVKLFALLRHYLVSVIVLIQSYNKISRACRINANNIIIFPACQNEIKVLLDEVTPACMSKKDFKKVIEYATSESHSFIHINTKAPKSEQVRKGFDEIINLNKYKI